MTFLLIISRYRSQTHLTLNGITLAMNHGIGSHDAVGLGFGADHFELDSSHATAYDERVIFVDRSVCFQEVWFQIHVKEIAVFLVVGVSVG